MNRIRLVASEVFLAVLLLSIPAVSSSMAANPTAGRPAPLISSIPTVQAVMSAPNDGTAGGLVGSESQAPSANSPITTFVFRGLSYDTTFACGAGLCDFHAAPPDVQVAVSPDYIVEMVNIIYGVWTRQGALVKVSGLASLWGTASDYIGDPKILYDSQSGRWFASLLDVSQGSVWVGASASNDPTGSWYTYSFKTSGYCPDQPILGVNTDKVMVSANDFLPGTKGCSGTFVGLQYWIFNKSEMLTGASVHSQTIPPDKNLFSLHPVHSLTPTETEYVVSSTSTSGPELLLYSITGVPPNPVTITQHTLSISSLNTPPAAPQLNAATKIDTGDNRVLDASWSNGTMWISLNDGCTPAGDSALRSCLRLIEVNTSTNSVLQDWDAAARSNYYFYPALRADSTGDLFVVFGYSTSSAYPSVAVAVHGFADPPNTLEQPITLAAGTGPEVNGTGSSGFCPSYPVCRYGDYFGATTDPSDPSLVWVGGEYGTQSGWSTWIAGVRMPGTQVPLTFSYTTAGGAPSGAPSVTFTSSGARQSSQLSSTPTTYLADYGTPWTVTNPLAGSTSTERWESNQSASGVASIATSTTFVFYHQFSVNFTFVVHGGSGFSPPSVNYSYFGSESSGVANFSGWVDSGSPYTYQNPLLGSSSERWEASSGTLGRVTASQSISPVFYHQFALTVSYQVSGGGTPLAPTISSVEFDSSYEVGMSTVPAQYWLDAGARWNATNPLPGSSSEERWFSESQASGTVEGGAALSIAYQHQFFVNLSATEGGSTSVGSGWFDAGQVLMATAKPSAGWALGTWRGTGSGSYSGNSTNISITVDRGISEQASFLPGLTLIASDGGTVAASFASSSRTIAGGRTYYLPPGTNISLSATPSFFLYQFNRWSGSSSSTPSTVQFKLTTPLTYRAEFGFNYINLGLIAGAILFLAAAAYAVSRGGRRSSSRS
ncbi:MAG: hypothetical protein E6K96_10145 [Thaumarchaeota archaeon]|nr:MAG: hypothetical protein E6K96_10145 [Nitrososphaerota archaeon]